MAKPKLWQEFLVSRDETKCIKCQACVRMCTNDVHAYDGATDTVFSEGSKCVGCHFCEDLCPTNALMICRNQSETKENANWKKEYIYNVIKQAESGGVLLAGMGCDKPYKDYFSHILLNASQVTNPSIDPLREPMELKTFIGRKPEKIEYQKTEGQKGL